MFGRPGNDRSAIVCDKSVTGAGFLGQAVHLHLKLGCNIRLCGFQGRSLQRFLDNMSPGRPQLYGPKLDNIGELEATFFEIKLVKVFSIGFQSNKVEGFSRSVGTSRLVIAETERRIAERIPPNLRILMSSPKFLNRCRDSLRNYADDLDTQAIMEFRKLDLVIE